LSAIALGSGSPDGGFAMNSCSSRMSLNGAVSEQYTTEAPSASSR
jgi:hypothetical protein